MSAPQVRSIPLLLLLAGCHAAPEPRAAPPREVVRQDEWQGGGGASTLHARGDSIANFALSLRGIRYLYGGATLDGFDCSGLVFYTHRHFGLDVPRTSSAQSEAVESVKEKELQPGDLVFFRIGSRKVNHVGIYIGRRRFVHAPGAGKPVTVDSLDEEFYEQAFSSAGRFWNRLPH